MHGLDAVGHDGVCEDLQRGGQGPGGGAVWGGCDALSI